MSTPLSLLRFQAEQAQKTAADLCNWFRQHDENPPAHLQASLNALSKLDDEIEDTAKDLLGIKEIPQNVWSKFCFSDRHKYKSVLHYWQAVFGHANKSLEFVNHLEQENNKSQISTNNTSMTKDELVMQPPSTSDIIRGPRVFISHSSKDEKVAAALVEFFEAALILRPGDIRCTTVPGYKLTTGAHASTQLSEEIRQAEVVMGIVTPNSIESGYVLFELGASWGLAKPTFPLLARGADTKSLPGPLTERHASSLSDRTGIYQMLDDFVAITKIERRPSVGARIETKAEALRVAAGKRI